MKFRESEAYLLSLGNEVETMKLGLENIRALLSALGDPQNQYKKVQVAGTNGKGSVCAFLDSICLKAGIKTGLYTSPHLVSIIERVRIGGVDISEDEFARIASHVRATSERLVADGVLNSVPTYFEQVTAIALLAFSEAKVELAILETGLGGRYDAVTAANAEICAITRIDLDHQEYLGETIEEIAAEKAAIIRADSNVVLADQSQEARKVLVDRCGEVGIVPRRNCEARVWAIDMVNTSAVASFNTEHGFYDDPNLGLRGRHQIENARVAVMLAEVLRFGFVFNISPENIVEGLEEARHPGRLERIGRFLLDGAHNVSGAMALRMYLDEFIAEPVTMIFGAMKDKNIREIAKILWPKAERLILTQPSNSRAMAVEKLSAYIPDGFDHKRVMLIDSVEAAMNIARNDSSNEATIVVTGSLYLVGEVKKLLNN
ncbi:MAG: bifunctional folylpolyglutamate synthase/dihydrofolate synthase [Pyrinomonadaceae bacterium]